MTIKAVREKDVGEEDAKIEDVPRTADDPIDFATIISALKKMEQADRQKLTASQICPFDLLLTGNEQYSKSRLMSNLRKGDSCPGLHCSRKYTKALSTN